MTAVRIAGDVLLAALGEWGITPLHDVSCFLVPFDPADLIAGVLGGPYIAIADHEPTVEGPADHHTGWLATILDEDGAPVATLHDGTATGPVDCAADSAAAAAAIADFVSAPLSRHCDCYSQERYGRRHDHECNRYARPRTQGVPA